MRSLFTLLALTLLVALNSTASAATVRWTSGAHDGQWDSAANWSTGTTPTLADDVVFDDVNTSDCLIATSGVKVRSVLIATTYTHKLEFGPGVRFTTTGNFEQQAGTFDFSQGTLEFQGSFLRSGGSVDGGYVEVTGGGAHTFQSGPGTLDFLSLTTTDRTSGSLTLSGRFQTGAATLNQQIFQSLQIMLSPSSRLTLKPGGSGLFLNGVTFTVQNGAYVDLTGTLGLSNYGIVQQQGTGRIHAPALAVGFTDVAGKRVTSATPGAPIYVSLADTDENTQGFLADTSSVIVKNTTTGDQEAVSVTETGANTGVFVNKTGLATALDTDFPTTLPIPGDGTLQFRPGDALTVSYTDPQDSADTLSHPLNPPTVKWTGFSGDGLWPTNLNWSILKPPARFDDVVFDASSTRTCTLDGARIETHDLTIASGFNGSIASHYIPSMHIFGNYVQNDGNIAYNKNDTNLHGNFNFNGGVSSGGGMRFVGEGTQTMLIGTTGFSADKLIADEPGKGVLNVGGSMTLDEELRVNKGIGTPAMNLQSGTITLHGALSVGSGTTLTLASGTAVDMTTSPGTFTNLGRIVLKGSARIQYPAGPLQFTDGDGTITPRLQAGNSIYVTLTDPNRNLDGTVAETVEVTVNSPETGDHETLTLTETGTHTGIFRNLTALPTAEGTVSQSNNGTLTIATNGTAHAAYTDPTDAGDTITADLASGAIIWDGGGSTNNWSDAQNWSPDTVPTPQDGVLFDGTSTKDCNVDADGITIAGMTINTGYTGTIDLNFNGDFTVLGDVLQNDGTLSGADAKLHVRTVTRNGGALSMGALQIDLSAASPNGGGSFGSAGATFGEVAISGPDGAVATFSGKLTATQAFAVNNGLGAASGQLAAGATLHLPSGSDLQIASGTTLKLASGATLDAQARPSWNVVGRIIEDAGAHILYPTGSLLFQDAGAGAVSTYAVGDPLYLRLTDKNRNLDGSVAETVVVTVSDLGNGDSLDVTLTETGPATGVFFGQIPIVVTAQKVDGDGFLQVGSAGTLRAEYSDPQDLTDNYASNLTKVAPQTTITDGGQGGGGGGGGGSIDNGTGTIDNGTVQPGDGGTSHTIVITNTGDSVLTINPIDLPPGYTIDPEPPISIDPGTSKTLTIHFNPTDGGTTSGTVTLHTNDPDTNPYTFTVTGKLDAPEISVFDSAGERQSGAGVLDFGDTPVGGANLSRTLTIKNVGLKTLTISDIGLPLQYTITQAPAMSLAPDAQTQMTVALVSVEAGAKNGTISILSNDANEGSFDVPTVGVVSDARLAVFDGATTVTAGATVDIGAAAIGSGSLQHTLTLRNEGTTTLTLGVATIDAPYQIASQPKWLAPGASGNLVLSLPATTLGTFVGDAVIHSNDADSPFALVVTGLIGKPEMVVKHGAQTLANGAATLDLGTGSQGGASPSDTLNILNNGSFALFVSQPEVTGGFAVEGAAAFTVVPGSSHTLTLTLPSNGSGGDHDGYVRIYTSDPAASAFVVRLAGSLALAGGGDQTGEVLNYLLGYTGDAAGLDFNGDGRVDIADYEWKKRATPPTAPFAPQPADGATSVPTQVTLSWSESNPLPVAGYDLWIWKASDAQPADPTTSGLSVAAFTLAALDEGTTYSWRVRVHGEITATDGPVWSFGTVPPVTTPQPVTLVLPNGGEQLFVGLPMPISWQCTAEAGPDWRAELWQNGSKVATMGSFSGPALGGSAVVTVPTVADGSYTVRLVNLALEEAANPRAYDDSDGTVTVTNIGGL